MTEPAREPVMQAAVRLGASLEALGALAAYTRIETENLDADPRVRQLLAEVAHELLGSAAPDEVAGSGAAVVGMTRALLAQAAELVENPGRSGAWDDVDERLLQGQGRVSASIVDAFRVAEGDLNGLRERFADESAAFLDVGTGTGWLAMAIARTYPAMRVTGIDVFEPALALARQNVAAEGFGERVTLRSQDVTSLDARESFDAIWLPLPFLPREIVPQALTACARALRPGGWVLPGTFGGADGKLAALLMDLRTVRCGGHPWRAEELIDTLTGHGFGDAREITRTWAAPVRLFAGRRA